MDAGFLRTTKVRADLSRTADGKVKYPAFLESYEQVFLQFRIFCTHEKAIQLISKGTGLISTFVFDEDPMKSLFKIDQIHLEDVKTVIARLADSESTMPDMLACLENVLSAEPNALVIPKDFTYGRIAFNKFIQGQVYEVQLEVFWIVPGI